MRPLVLTCSANVDFYTLFRHILETDGFASELADDVETALKIALKLRPQAVVLDCQPGWTAGPNICARFKRESQTHTLPVIALIAQGAQDQYLDLLRAGVDECFVRPVMPAKLLDCLHGLLATSDNGFEKRLRHGDLEVSLDAHRVRCNGQDIPVGPIEFRLLRHLLENSGRVRSRNELIAAAWPDDADVDPRTVDVHIGRIRKSLKPHTDPHVIRTVRAAGYVLRAQDE